MDPDLKVACGLLSAIEFSKPQFPSSNKGDVTYMLYITFVYAI